MKQRARCIKDFFDPYTKKHTLYKDHFYFVKDEDNFFYHVFTEDGQRIRGSFLKTRFEIVEEESIPPTLREPGIKTMSAMSFEDEEKKLKEAWKASLIRPGECICGIPKSGCTYHR